MEPVLVTTAIHVLTAVYWAGTTFALARTGGASAERLFAPQMAAATIAILSGAYLWKLTHAGGFERAEQILAAGALCALIAAGMQGLFASLALRRGASDDGPARSRLAMAYRISAGLLVITVLTMATARYL